MDLSKFGLKKLPWYHYSRLLGIMSRMADKVSEMLYLRREIKKFKTFTVIRLIWDGAPPVKKEVHTFIHLQKNRYGEKKLVHEDVTGFGRLPSEEHSIYRQYVRGWMNDYYTDDHMIALSNKIEQYYLREA